MRLVSLASVLPSDPSFVAGNSTLLVIIHFMFLEEQQSDSPENLFISPLSTADYNYPMPEWPLTVVTCLQDALSEIARQRHKDLTKPLRLHFIGEDGIDAGGVKKEFFQLLVTELLCPDYGMLIFQQVRIISYFTSLPFMPCLHIYRLTSWSFLSNVPQPSPSW